MEKRKTPVMGWASWNCFRTNIDEKKIKRQADALINTGLAEYGYEYLNIDDGFFGGRDEQGKIISHPVRFPNGMKAVADYIHSLGLKAGIYADGGDNTCGFYYDSEGGNGINVGLYGYEKQDLEMYFTDWGYDFIKVDWCGGLRLGLDEQTQYTKIGKIIDDIRRNTGKEIVYNICRWQFPGAWAAEIADSWRTGADIAPVFGSVIHQIDNIKRLVKYCSPGHTNDLDMMQLGNGMNEEEEKTHFAMWCMMSAPLMIGCDLEKIEKSTLDILKNTELIKINQDSACLQAYVIKEITAADGNISGEIWIKNLGKNHSNKKAVALLNRSDNVLNMSVKLTEAGFDGKILSIRDVCAHKDMECVDFIENDVAAHGVIVYVIESEAAHKVKDIYKSEAAEDSRDMTVTLEQAKQLVKNGACLVDVREADEYLKKHIENSINVPYTDIHAIAGDFLKDKNADIIVYCMTGKRSFQAKQSLDYLGYKNVYFLGGLGELLC